MEDQQLFDYLHLAIDICNPSFFPAIVKYIDIVKSLFFNGTDYTYVFS